MSLELLAAILFVWIFVLPVLVLGGAWWLERRERERREREWEQWERGW